MDIGAGIAEKARAMMGSLKVVIEGHRGILNMCIRYMLHMYIVES